MKKLILLAIACIGFPIACLAQYSLRGTVVDSITQRPLEGATVKLKGAVNGARTTADGTFKLEVPALKGTILISYVGYRAIIRNYNDLNPQIFALTSLTTSLGEVVVSTGYQNIPEERATGSFVSVDNNLLNRRVSTDVLSRLEDVTSGLVFNRNVPGRTNDITIRGQSTLFSNAQPLIILDNFPYDGDLTNLNPNEIDNVTVLKDAAAASIWGSRAGNGVIVITTKKGAYNRPVHISFNSNVTIGNKPDLFYPSRMSTSDYIDVEEKLFNKGFFNAAVNSPFHTPLTPVVQLLYAEKAGTISADQANARINTLRSYDDRNDFNKYFYQKSIAQQYALNLDGGTANQKYVFGVGYDDDRANLVRNGFQRLNINASNSYSFFNHHLELTTGLYLTQSKITQNNTGISGVFMNSVSGLYPYAKLADNKGNPLSVVKDYSTSYLQSVQGQGLLDWQYSPLQELRLANNSSSILDYRLNSALTYHLTPHLSAQVLYLYERGTTDAENYQSQDTYYTRNLINSYTQVNPDGSLTYGVPPGGIVDRGLQTAYTNDFRAQVNFDQNIGSKGQLNAIGGYEIRSIHTAGNNYRLYGYDNQHDISSPVDYVTQYPIYFFPAETNTVPYNDSGSDLTDHNLSYYANAAYNYAGKYTISGSARFDQSNLFGVNANQKGVPLWSAGAAWNLSEEPWYKLTWLPYLKLRLTYGVSGNVNKSVSAYTTAYYYNAAYSPIGLPYAMIVNPPDPDLSWERIRTWNLGMDFRLIRGRLSGTIEVYQKDGVDLIGSTPIAPSSGVELVTGNNASTKAHGIDLILNSKNLNGPLTWQSNFLLSYNKTIVTKYEQEAPVSSYLQLGYGGDNIPLKGKPLYAIYSYQWAGLDPANGNPRGYLNGQVSENYAGIISAATPENIVYNGPAQPTVFGSFRNTWSWKRFSLSGNISYRLGYYIRKASVRYATVLRDQGGNGDYALRWQNPGDEAHTHVPSVPASINLNRDNLYTYSNILVGKGDNIRWQDLSLSYDLIRAQSSSKLPFSHASVYFYANNLALLWKANHFGIDPDYQNGPSPKTFALGFKADFK